MIDIPQDFVLASASTPFPAIERALKEPNGLIAIGGELSTQRLLEAYSQGIFPWYSEQDPVLWYSPNPRMVMTSDRLHISKSLQKTLNSDKFQIKVDTNFEQIIHHCKMVERKDQTGTWIDQAMVDAYTDLYQQGFVRCVGVYQESRLVGGLYGVSLGKVFFGESMFSLVADSSKVAFAHLLKNMGYSLVDCQVESPHLKSLGAFNVERHAFIQSLQELL